MGRAVCAAEGWTLESVGTEPAQWGGFVSFLLLARGAESAQWGGFVCFLLLAGLRWRAADGVPCKLVRRFSKLC